jgi:hypothetical protein
MLIAVPLGLAGLALGFWLLARTSREHGRSSIGATERSRGRVLAMVFGGFLGRKRD